MREVQTTPPSFPEDALLNQSLTVAAGQRWQVLCGDAEHWRLGIYSPGEQRAAELDELETHDCPELFVLLQGELTLLLFEGGALCERPLEPGRPLLVTVPHAGFCPGGPHSGVALVVERDRFSTVYHSRAELLRQA